MKLFLYKSISFIMAFVVLLSTMSFTIDKHYCGSVLVDVSINKSADACDMGMTLSPEKVLTGKKSCCQDEHIVILGQDELKKGLDNGIEFQFVSAILQQHTFSLVLGESSSLFTVFGNHDPPSIRQDFYKLYQTYLI